MTVKLVYLGTEWNDGEILDSDDLNDTFTAAYTAMNPGAAIAMSVAEINFGEVLATSAGSDDMVWWSPAHDSEIDTTNTTQVNYITLQSSGSPTASDCAVWIDFDLSDTAQSMDYTAGSRPAGWTADKFTWDAANDEDDGSLTQNQTGYVETDTSYTNGKVHIKARNLAEGTNGFGYIGVGWGDDFIRLNGPNSSEGIGGPNDVYDSEGGLNTTLTGFPTTIEFELTRQGDFIRTRYKATGGGGSGSWVTLFEGKNDGSAASNKPRCQAYCRNVGGSTAACSQYFFDITDNYYNSGDLVIDMYTKDETKQYATATYIGTLPTDTTITTNLSADNGSNYTAIAEATTAIGDTGTQIKQKFTLAQTDSGDASTPIFKFGGFVLK